MPSNEQWTYVWKVPERAGPGPADPSSVMWMYHSHTAEAADAYAGLMGAIVISRKGVLQASGLPQGIDRCALVAPAVVLCSAMCDQC